jgi:transcriptional regulator with XRE-family HTH domain
MGDKRATRIDRHIASRIREGRRAAGLTQGFVGDKLGITFQQIQKYERGDNRIAAGRLFEISQLFGVPFAYFFEGLRASRTNTSDAPEQSRRGRGRRRLA